MPRISACDRRGDRVPGCVGTTIQPSGECSFETAGSHAIGSLTDCALHVFLVGAANDVRAVAAADSPVQAWRTRITRSARHALHDGWPFADAMTGFYAAIASVPITLILGHAGNAVALIVLGAAVAGWLWFATLGPP